MDQSLIGEEDWIVWISVILALTVVEEGGLWALLQSEQRGGKGGVVGDPRESSMMKFYMSM